MDTQYPGFNYEPFDPKYRRCGCYIRNLLALHQVKPKTHVAMPLKHIDYDIEITNGLVSTTLQQTYINPIDKYLEIDFSFPIDPNACIYKFVAEFGNKRIEGVVKEKQEAKKEYKEAVKQGKQAAYVEIDPNSKDILNMQIGNVGPHEEVKVTISYLQELKVQQNTFYQLHLSSTVSPRYMSNHKGKLFAESVQSVKGEYTWAFKISLLTSRKLVYYVSHSHSLQLLSQNQQKTETILCLAKEEKPNVDLFFLFTVEDFHLPNYVLGRTDISSTAMLSFIPKFCELNLDDAMKASMNKKEIETDLSAAKGEYIFLLDRSGSMGGLRIQKAKQALILFLQSLPEDTYFNVVSFGYNSDLMFTPSVKYCNQNLKIAVNKIKKMEADMGGTQIYNPLKKVFEAKTIEGYPKQIFLLTDGGVSDTEGVIDMVGKEVKYSRCHAIGIGNGCSEALIKGSAEKGKGQYIFISDSENPSESIIRLLEETLTPVIDRVSLKYDNKIVESIVPNPDSLPYILKNEVVNFYITFKGQLEKETSFIFAYKDSLNKVPYETSIKVSPQSLNMPFIDKMAHNKIIKNLQAAAKENKPVEEYMYYVKVVDKKKEAIAHSVKHQILSSFTAFVCISKELIDGKYQEIQDTGSLKVKVQPLKPQNQIEDDVRPLRMQKMSFCNSSPLTLKCSAKVAKKSFLGNAVSSVTNFFSKQIVNPLSSRSQKRSAERSSQQNRKTLNMACDKKVQLQQKFEQACMMGQMKMEFKNEQFQECEQVQKCEQFKMKKKQKKFQQKQEKQKKSLKEKIIGIEDVIKQQNVDGSFLSQDLLKQLLPQQFLEILKQAQTQNIEIGLAITYIIAKWIEKKHPEKQYGLIVKKALSFLKKSAKLQSLQVLDKFIN